MMMMMLLIGLMDITNGGSNRKAIHQFGLFHIGERNGTKTKLCFGIETGRWFDILHYGDIINVLFFLVRNTYHSFLLGWFRLVVVIVVTVHHYNHMITIVIVIVGGWDGIGG